MRIVETTHCMRCTLTTPCVAYPTHNVDAQWLPQHNNTSHDEQRDHTCNSDDIMCLYVQTAPGAARAGAASFPLRFRDVISTKGQLAASWTNGQWFSAHTSAHACADTSVSPLRVESVTTVDEASHNTRVNVWTIGGVTRLHWSAFSEYVVLIRSVGLVSVPCHRAASVQG